MKRLENKGFGLEWFVFIMVMLIPKLSLFAQQDSLWVLETVIDNYELQMEDLEDIENISEELLERMESCSCLIINIINSNCILRSMDNCIVSMSWMR